MKKSRPHRHSNPSLLWTKSSSVETSHPWIAQIQPTGKIPASMFPQIAQRRSILTTSHTRSQCDMLQNHKTAELPQPFAVLPKPPSPPSLVGKLRDSLTLAFVGRWLSHNLPGRPLKSLGHVQVQAYVYDRFRVCGLNEVRVGFGSFFCALVLSASPSPSLVWLAGWLVGWSFTVRRPPFSSSRRRQLQHRQLIF